MYIDTYSAYLQFKYILKVNTFTLNHKHIWSSPCLQQLSFLPPVRTTALNCRSMVPSLFKMEFCFLFLTFWKQKYVIHVLQQFFSTQHCSKIHSGHIFIVTAAWQPLCRYHCLLAHLVGMWVVPRVDLAEWCYHRHSETCLWAAVCRRLSEASSWQLSIWVAGHVHLLFCNLTP